MNMIRYRNVQGDSGVTAYSIGDDWIRVQFRGHDDVYVYDWRRPGREHVEQMKRLAVSGRGLASYISRHVGDNYAAKEPLKHTAS
jgi:hypothetical protein